MSTMAAESGQPVHSGFMAHTREEEPFPEDAEPPTPPPKDAIDRPLISPIDVESYFNSFNSMRPSRTNSVYSLSRVSFSNQLSQLTSLHLPNATSLSTSISSIPTAPIAAKAFSNAAEQMRKWLQKASEVLSGLDAEDDVEWAAAGGREGLGEVDAAIGKFEGLIGIYVTAIEDLQERQDISDVPPLELKSVVDQMEIFLKEWDNVRRLLKGVKSQVELAMEWEELWNVVLGDIGLEMESLSRLVFEMEESRHRALLVDPSEAGATLDIQELDTIVEETPMVGSKQLNHRFSLPSIFPASSPITSTAAQSVNEDSNLLALFARMQPLRASLDFLPMTLSSFHTRAEKVLPTSCEELESRRQSLEKKWKKLESDAEGLRRELSEDRWILVFRNAGRQAQKLCESVERSISKLQESIDIGAQHSNPPALAKKVGDYEAKKIHYGPAIERVLAIIEKGVKDRVTVNGEILRLHLDTRASWTNIEAEMKDMDIALDDLAMNRNQQLRDSISSIVSMDRSVTGSAADTPGSSPASSVVMGPSNGYKGDYLTPGMNSASRRSSVISSTTSRPTSSRRYTSMGSGSAGSTQLPRKSPGQRSFASDSWSPSNNIPSSPYSKQSSSTPTPGSRPPRPTMFAIDNKPRWNSSPKVDHIDFGSKHKAPAFSTPASGRNSSLAFRFPHHNDTPSSHIPFPSPLGRSGSSSPAPTAAPHSSTTHLRLSGNHNDPRRISSSPVRSPFETPPLRSKASIFHLSSSNSAASSKRQSIMFNNHPVLSSPSESKLDSPPVRPKRPVTAMANGRRSSMLPLPKNVIAMEGSGSGNGRQSAMGGKNGGREAVMMGRVGGWK